MRPFLCKALGQGNRGSNPLSIFNAASGGQGLFGGLIRNGQGALDSARQTTQQAAQEGQRTAQQATDTVQQGIRGQESIGAGLNAGSNAAQQVVPTN